MDPLLVHCCPACLVQPSLPSCSSSQPAAPELPLQQHAGCPAALVTCRCRCFAHLPVRTFKRRYSALPSALLDPPAGPSSSLITLCCPAAGAGGRVKPSLFPPFPGRLLFGPRVEFTFPVAQFQKDWATGSSATVAAKPKVGVGKGRGRRWAPRKQPTELAGQTRCVHGNTSAQHFVGLQTLDCLSVPCPSADLPLFCLQPHWRRPRWGARWRPWRRRCGGWQAQQPRSDQWRGHEEQVGPGKGV